MGKKSNRAAAANGRPKKETSGPDDSGQPAVDAVVHAFLAVCSPSSSVVTPTAAVVPSKAKDPVTVIARSKRKDRSNEDSGQTQVASGQQDSTDAVLADTVSATAMGKRKKPKHLKRKIAAAETEGDYEAAERLRRAEKEVADAKEMRAAKWEKASHPQP